MSNINSSWVKGTTDEVYAVLAADMRYTIAKVGRKFIVSFDGKDLAEGTLAVCKGFGESAHKANEEALQAKKGKRKSRAKKTEAPAVEAPTEAPVAEVIEAPVAEEVPVVAAPAPVLKFRERDTTGLSFIWAVATSKGCPIPIPADLLKPTLLQWCEDLITHYEGRGLYLTNSGLKSWRGWLTISGWKAATGEYLGAEQNSYVFNTLSDLIASRFEPAALNADARMNKALIHMAGSTTTTPVPTTATVAVPVQATEATSVKKTTTPTASPGASCKEIDVTCSVGKKGGKRFSVFGVSVTGIIRWMGSEAWTLTEARKACQTMGLTGLADVTIQTQISAGKKGDGNSHGPIPELQEAHKVALRSLIGE